MKRAEKGGRPMQFRERDDGDLADYLAEGVGEEITREALLNGMERLLSFTRGATYQWEEDLFALVYATIARSARTFTGICQLLRSGLAVQSAMLTRSLFEDVIVAHWLILNADDSEWLTDRFLRQREAIALLQLRIRQETGMSMGPPLTVSDDVAEREAALIREFGRQASRDWWDPGKEGRGTGGDVGLRKVVSRLEEVAAKRKMFHPRFAGGEEPLLKRTDRVVHKWLSQCLHHTVIGLPFSPTEKNAVEVAPDPMLVVGFSSAWLFAQQVYLVHEVNQVGFREIDTVWFACMSGFLTVMVSPEATEELAAEWSRVHGDPDEK